jgi:hypothetical protein
MRCWRSVAEVAPRPKLPLKTRSRICAVSISKRFDHDGAAYFQRPPPDRLPRNLLFAIIAYRIQADRLGDLDHETEQVLDRTDAKDTGATMSARLVSFDQKRTLLTPGTVLVREWDRRSQRVMVMADGFAWDGQTYDSLSKVAFAITGSKWNGPRFFGLRDKEDSVVSHPATIATRRSASSIRNGHSGSTWTCHWQLRPAWPSSTAQRPTRR